jgi:hypothetical protein
MGTNTFRYESQERPLSPAVYWRRRFLALVVGLAILAALAWAISGVLPSGPSGPASQAQGRGTSGSGGTGSGGPGAGSASSPGATPSGTPPGGGTSQNSPPKTSGSASGLPRHCQASDIVISVSASRSSYRRAQSPEFDVDVVSTAGHTCAFNVGPKFLSVVVMAGRKRVWSSADCVQGRGSLMTNLARGVPTVLPITWDRGLSAPGCAAMSGQVRSGSFVASASDGSVASNSVAFRLR